MRDEKQSLRKTILPLRRVLSPDVVSHNSAAIAERFLSAVQIEPTAVVHIYLAIPGSGEVETRPLINAISAQYPHIIYCAPVLDAAADAITSVRFDPSTTWASGPLGIPQPVSGEQIGASQISVVIVPLVAFDADCNRLGYGRGIYDRFLSALAPTAIKVGLAHEIQRLARVPQDAWDRQLDLVITERETYRVKNPD
jgi:5-formyltetrahydrofolate cyclo-ligase